MDGGFGDVEEGVDQRPFARMLITEDDQRSVGELFLRAGLVQELVPHDTN